MEGMIRRVRRLMMGERSKEMGEVPVKGKIRKMRMIIPYWLRMAFHSFASSWGRKPTRILPPSRG